MSDPLAFLLRFRLILLSFVLVRCVCLDKFTRELLRQMEKLVHRCCWSKERKKTAPSQLRSFDFLLWWSSTRENSLSRTSAIKLITPPRARRAIYRKALSPGNKGFTESSPRSDSLRKSSRAAAAGKFQREIRFFFPPGAERGNYARNFKYIGYRCERIFRRTTYISHQDWISLRG